MLTMRKLGKHGRFANQLFQYAYLRIASKNDYQCPAWIGQTLFGHNDSPVEKHLPQVKNHTIGQDNVDIVGYFQGNTGFYAPYKEFFRSLFQPKIELRKQLDSDIKIAKQDRMMIGLHLRRGDYGTFGRKSARWTFIAPTQWYLDWLKKNIVRFVEPVIFLASDEPEKVAPDFAGEFPIFWWKQNSNFYKDFYTLTQCDCLLISNSSFGFAASMLNEHATEFYRPRLSEKRLIPYDPWNSETVLMDERY